MNPNNTKHDIDTVNIEKHILYQKYYLKGKMNINVKFVKQKVFNLKFKLLESFVLVAVITSYSSIYNLI